MCKLHVAAQKPVIDSTVFGKWEKVQGGELSRDGKYAVCHVNFPGKGDLTIVKATGGTWERPLWNIGQGVILRDSRSFVFQRKDSLYLMHLGGSIVNYITSVTSFEVLQGAEREWLACFSAAEGGRTKLVLRPTGGGDEWKIDDVRSFQYNESANVLIIQKQDSGNINSSLVYEWLDLSNRKQRCFWTGAPILNMTFDRSDKQLAFIAEEEGQQGHRLWYYRDDMVAPKQLLVEGDIDTSLVVSEAMLRFNRGGDKLFFELKEKPFVRQPMLGVKVDVWSYRDEAIQEESLAKAGSQAAFKVCMDLRTGKTLQLEKEGVRLISELDDVKEFVILQSGSRSDCWWRDTFIPTYYLMSLRDGQRILLKRKIPFGDRPVWVQKVTISPKERFVIYYDPIEGDFCSYEIGTGRTRDITKGMGVNWGRWDRGRTWGSIMSTTPDDIAAWTENDDAVLLYDKWDIWLVDPLGIAKAINLTDGYGRAHHLMYRLRMQFNGKEVEGLRGNEDLLLSAFDTANKYSGFYRLRLGQPGQPELLTMGPYQYQCQMRAADASQYLLRRESAEEATNYYVSRDLKQFTPITRVAPQKRYNWLHSDLVTWPMPSGRQCQGMLFTPENFDSQQKYPLIVYYYEEESQNLYEYNEPGPTQGAINIPYFVSRGYVVFEPDMHPLEGATGKCALETVVSGVRFLSKEPWIDTTRIGIQGHSFGGYETNYIVTHTNLFAAAAEGAGVSDMIGDYSSLVADGKTNHYIFELGAYCTGASPWQRPEVYLEGSPILQADKVTTPILILHNKKDFAVPWSQGVEFFTALRRNDRKVWMLQYDEGDHVVYRKAALDFTIRIEQFFDHYLKGAPPPLWMTEGIPAKRKGIDDGLQLDRSGKQP